MFAVVPGKRFKIQKPTICSQNRGLVPIIGTPQDQLNCTRPDCKQFRNAQGLDFLRLALGNFKMAIHDCYVNPEDGCCCFAPPSIQNLQLHSSSMFIVFPILSIKVDEVYCRAYTTLVRFVVNQFLSSLVWGLVGSCRQTAPNFLTTRRWGITPPNIAIAPACYRAPKP